MAKIAANRRTPSRRLWVRNGALRAFWQDRARNRRQPGGLPGQDWTHPGQPFSCNLAPAAPGAFYFLFRHQQMQVSLCPMRMRALKISTIEPYLTRDGVDVVTYRCPIDGDIWRSVVVIRVEAGQYGKIATLLAP